MVPAMESFRVKSSKKYEWWVNRMESVSLIQYFHMPVKTGIDQVWRFMFLFLQSYEDPLLNETDMKSTIVPMAFHALILVAKSPLHRYSCVDRQWQTYLARATAQKASVYMLSTTWFDGTMACVIPRLADAWNDASQHEELAWFSSTVMSTD